MGLVSFVLVVAESGLALGGVTAFVSLVPVALAVVLGGRLGGAVVVGVALGGTAALVGGPAVTVVACRHAAPGLALGLVLARRLTLPVCLLVVSLTGAAGLAAVVSGHLPAGVSLLGFLERRIDAHVADLERLPAVFRLSDDPAWMTESARLVGGLLRRAAPAVLLVGLLVMALANYVVARLCLRGRGFRPFAEEAVPDHLVWGVIAGGAMLLVEGDLVTFIGLNLLIVLVPPYAIQGLAVLRHFFQKAGLPRPIQGMSFGLFALQPILLVLAACLGLSDLWVDFRKIRRAATPA